MLLHCYGLEQPVCSLLLDSGDTSYCKFDNLTALDQYKRAYGQCPDSYDALMKMTRAYIDHGSDMNTKEAIDFFKQGLYLTDILQLRYPDSAQSYFLKAVAAANITRLKKGTQRVKLARVIEYNAKKSIVIAPSFAPAWVLLGGYYREVATANFLLKAFARIFFGGLPEGTLEDSHRTLQKALQLSPGNVYAHLEFARTNAAMGKKNEAIASLRQMQNLPLAWHLDSKLKEEGRQFLVQLQR